MLELPHHLTAKTPQSSIDDAGKPAASNQPAQTETRMEGVYSIVICDIDEASDYGCQGLFPAVCLSENRKWYQFFPGCSYRNRILKLSGSCRLLRVQFIVVALFYCIE